MVCYDIIVDAKEICGIPIGQDDIDGSLVYVLYRNCPPGGNGLESWAKNIEKHGILHECGREKSGLSFN